MYSFFRHIPLAKRQEAFDLYRSARQLRVESDADAGMIHTIENDITVSVRGFRTCPLGALNVALGIQQEWTNLHPSHVYLPNDADDEDGLLEEAGFSLTDDDLDDMQDFIDANDGECFQTFDQLARAMGVAYGSRVQAVKADGEE